MALETFFLQMLESKYMPLEYNGALLYSAEYAIYDGQWCDVLPVVLA